MAACKRDVWPFQESWTTDFGFISQDDRAVCVLCCQNIACRTSSIKRHFETKHEKSFEDDAEKIKSLKKKGISLRKAKQHFQERDFWGKSNNRK